MTIEGLGKKFQEARRARDLTLDEAARMTKIRPARLAEIEADDFSQFPSLAYAKGFLLIYGKFLDVDVTPYLDAFEDSERVTVDGYSYLQDNPPPKPVSAPVVRRRSRSPSRIPSRGSDRISPMPLIFGLIVLVIGFSAMKLILNLRRLAPGEAEPTAQISPGAPSSPISATPPPAAAETPTSNVASAPVTAPSVTPAPTPKAVGVSGSRPTSGEPEVRKAKPVLPEDLAKPPEKASSPPAESSAPNRVAIRPLKRTYLKVTVDDQSENPAFERWVSPADGTVEFRGNHVSIRVLERDAVQVMKNGKALEEDDEDVTVD
jgi:cytoskeleton protein RodZ